MRLRVSVGSKRGTPKYREHGVTVTSASSMCGVSAALGDGEGEGVAVVAGDGADELAPSPHNPSSTFVYSVLRAAASATLRGTAGWTVFFLGRSITCRRGWGGGGV